MDQKPHDRGTNNILARGQNYRSFVMNTKKVSSWKVLEVTLEGYVTAVSATTLSPASSIFNTPVLFTIHVNRSVDGS